MDDGELTDEAAAAFAAVGNEFRLRVLYHLDIDERRPFSDLQAALGEDDPGRLNYHLNELRGTFVDRSEEGYRLTLRGSRILNTVLAERYTVGTGYDEARYETPVDGACYECGAADLTLSQYGKGAAVICGDCGTFVVSLAFPVAAWQSHPDDAVPRVFDEWVRQDVAAVRAGACPECSGAVETRIEADALDFPYTPRFDCTVCTRRVRVPHGLLAWDHPTVRAFHREHGTDPADLGFWALPQAVDDDYTDFPSTDPVRAVVRFPLDGAECRVHFDADATIERIERETPA